MLTMAFAWASNPALYSTSLCLANVPSAVVQMRAACRAVHMHHAYTWALKPVHWFRMC